MEDEQKYPHFIPVKHIFIRGSVVRYIHLPKEHVDTDLLQESARRSARPAEETAEH